MVKTISLLVVSIFLFVQVASASHVHAHDHHPENDSPEPNVCVVCLASQQDDEGEFDLPTPPALIFVIPNTLELNLQFVSDRTLGLSLTRVNAPDPPHLRLSAPRAPPV